MGYNLNSIVEGIIDPQGFGCRIKENNLSWFLYVDVYCLDDDGNIFDTSLIAVLGALRNVTLPNVRIENNVVVSSKEKPNKLTLTYLPLSLTFCVMDTFILCDPTSEEENLQSGSFTIVMRDDGELTSIINPGSSCLDGDQLKACFLMCQKRVKKIQNLFFKAQKSEIINFK